MCTDQNPDKADFTIHLVCAQPQQTSEALTTTQSNNNRRPVVTPPPQSTTTSNSQASSYGRHQNLSNQQPDAFFSNLVRSGSQQQHHQNHNTIINNVFDLTNNVNNDINSSSSSNSSNSSTNNAATNIANILTGINSYNNGSGLDARIISNPYLNNVIHSRNSTLDPQAQQALFQQMAQLVATQLNQLTSGASVTAGTIPVDLSSQTTILGPGTYSISSVSAHHSVGAQFNVNQFQHNLVRGGPNPGSNVNLNNNRADVNVVQDPVGAADFRDNAPNVDQARQMQQEGNLDAQRHLLDWLYYTFRALVLMTALYVHSSYKFIFVVCFMAFCYFYKKRMANRQAHRQNEQRVMGNNNRNQVLNDQAIHNYIIDREENNNLRNRRAPVLNDGNGAEPVTQGNVPGNIHPAQEARLPLLKIIYMVVSSFIISLIPDNQADNQV